MELRIFYDGNCPLCSAEMRQLKARDPNNFIALEDLNAPDFSERFSHIDRDYANTILHGETATGEVLLGLDVTCKAWALTETRAWIQLLRLPVIKTVADWTYLRFAKHRYRISYLLTGKARCDDNCQIPTKRR
ncbi:DUF393 domain-containing protein [Shewanella sp. SP2S2-4]|uniref:Putative thiol-disulphide oxidoreductase DCC n=1 Tax=Shewanella baltica (strain OS195) TaxID=399599 RepID=A9L339_SHEB9|nr:MULTISPECIES: DUF393 domain-containing protein [Shewanella]ABX50968.1 putative thiol-disulphide oxidoreductase DCC [Shewanella baltica OS195]ADT95969.1 thiol-disulfide oxidoreductase DCC [Shewanella baltica OS678]EHC08023.1 thiol-disulfide oxidoreductase DCC [Shewanella baltica OS625]MCS6229842.1 DUF393 domain-containing protein [Shewanella baltica]MDT3272204.1 DUF393 domain-containing protein [Shewanella sp. SP2S2-4]